VATKAQKVAERLRLAAQEAAKGNAAGAAAYAQAAANIRGSGQARVQEVANTYAENARLAAQTEKILTEPPKDPGRFSSDNIPPGFDPSNYPGGGGGGGGGDTTPAEDTGPTPEERAAASAFLANILRQYGMEGMMGQIDALIGQWGTNGAVIVEKLRETGEYKQRFKGLINLRSKGITDIANEGQYIQFESSYRKVFRDNNLQSYLGEAGSQQEIDKIASLVGDFSLSVDEVEERVIDARRVIADTAPEVRESLQRFYNIDPDLMVEFVLDPENTSEVIQRRANAAVVGGYAERAGLEFGAGVSERIGAFLGGERDIQGTQIEPQLTEIADIQRSTQRLAEIEQSELSAETSALSALNLEESARRRVRNLQSRERARFGGRSAITTASLSEGPGV